MNNENNNNEYNNNEYNNNEYNNNENNNNDNNKLDDDWINNFEKTDELYQDFYKDDLYYINLKYIYISRANEIEKIKQESFLMSRPNYISREEILQILKKSVTDDDRRYSLLSILKYNITLDAEEIKKFVLHEDIQDNEERNYLKIIKNIDAIALEKTINMLHDLNDIILIFYEKSNELKVVNPHTSTKKIYLRSLSSNNKKTIRKQYKD
jgi:hypothetical protein